MKLSIIIVAYNSESVLFDCLDSIEKYNDIGSELEVIIVDNFSASELSSTTFEKYDITIKYLRNEKNGGFGAGNNWGAKNSNSEILFFLNPDTILIEPIFQNIVSKITDNSDLIYSFSLLDKNMKVNNSYSFLYDNFFLFHVLSIIQSLKLRFIFKIPFVNRKIWPWGAAFALTKESFIKAGCFDENIFLCNEEQDLIKRIPSRYIFLSDKRIIHLEGHGTIVSENRWLEYFKSREYYFSKYKISNLNRTLWDKYTHLIALLNSKCLKDQSRLNYYRAYMLFLKLK